MRLYIGLENFSKDIPTSAYLSAVNHLLSRTWNLDFTSTKALTAHVDRCRTSDASEQKSWAATATGRVLMKVELKLELLPDSLNTLSAVLVDGSIHTA